MFDLKGGKGIAHLRISVTVLIRSDARRENPMCVAKMLWRHPPVTTDKVKAIELQEELAALATKVIHAESLADLGLNGTA